MKSLKLKDPDFITTLIPISSKEKIEESLLKIRKNYFDATHNCYAWRLGLQGQQDLFLKLEYYSEQERAMMTENPVIPLGNQY